jgi:murein DD-endopeptidase MepM/ murein hydrolase activator NlpD
VFNVIAGQTVLRCDVIGYYGSTGRSTGAHLHYEILANGKLLNPLQLLTQQQTQAP